MFLSGPLLGFLGAVAIVLAGIAVPAPAASIARYIGQLATPLALIFVGMTIFAVGFARLRNMPREVWLILASCYLIRPLTMYLCTMPMGMDPLMRQVFVAASALPVSSVIGVLSKTYGADEEYASSAIGLSTVALIPVLPFLLTVVSFVR